jgi:hypothetical protein
VGETLTLREGPRWRGRSRGQKAIVVALIAVSASLLPSAASFVPQARGVGLFGVANAACKWDNKPGPGGVPNIYDHWYFKAQVVSNWCYDGNHVLSRNSVPSGNVTSPLGVLAGYFLTETHWALSQCYTINHVFNSNCLTHREYNIFDGHDGSHRSICIETRIYGNGYHRRRITETEIDACGDGNRQPWWWL